MRTPTIRLQGLATVLAAALSLSQAICCTAQVPDMKVYPRPGEPQAQFDQRTKWWREAKFGMFIHWGIYAVPADATTKDGNKSAAEWYFFNKQAQVKDYEKFAGQFNPVRFDARR